MFKMPELSQDVFELANPGTPPATPEELRLRANSNSSSSGNFLMPPPENRKKKVSDAELDSFWHIDYAESLYGHKRESSHR